MTFTDYQQKVENGLCTRLGERKRSIQNAHSKNMARARSTNLSQTRYRSKRHSNLDLEPDNLKFDDQPIIFEKKAPRPATGINRIFPMKDERNLYMQFPPTSSLAKLKYRMINRATKKPMYDVDRFSHKKKCDVVEYARLVEHLKKTFGGDG